MRSKEQDRRVGRKRLRHDIMNAINYVFGHGDKCSSDFCGKALDVRTQLQEEETSDIFDEQIQFWNEVTDQQLIADSRNADPKSSPISTDLRLDVCQISA